MKLWISILFAAGCVKGNPVDLGDFTGTGGSLTVPGCNYTLTTRDGAEAPKLSSDVLGADPTPVEVHLGLMADPKTSIVAQWRTKDETTRASEIRYGVGANLPADQLTMTASGIEFGFKGTGMDVYRVHQAHLCNLTAGTTYSYQVGSTGHFSQIFTFHTAPDISANGGNNEVVFGFVGDSRGGYDIFDMLMAQIKSRSPDLLLFSGDAVTIGLTQYEWEDFFTRAEPLFATVPLVSAHGNHEVNAVNYYSQIVGPGDQQNFGFDYGYAHITVANDTPEDPASINGEFKDKIQADFTSSDSAKWKLFMHHQPMFSASTRHGPSLTLQQAWLPMIDQHHIDLVLNGHDHDYEITKPLINGQAQTTSDNATVFVVAGGAGAELYGNGTDTWTQYSESDYSAAMIHVSKTMLSLTPFHADGSPLDPKASFSKTK